MIVQVPKTTRFVDPADVRGVAVRDRRVVVDVTNADGPVVSHPYPSTKQAEAAAVDFGRAVQVALAPPAPAF